MWKTMQRDNLAKKPNILTSMNNSGIYSIDSFITTEAKITTLMKRIESLETPTIPK